MLFTVPSTADFKENHTLSAKQENLSLFMNSILWNGKMRIEKQTKLKSEKPQFSA